MDSIDVPHDGDCLFTSIALFLLQYYGSNTDVNSDLMVHCRTLNLLPCMSQTEFVKRLRELLVEEWLSNQEVYQPFFLNEEQPIDFVFEARRYTQFGAYESCIGDAMILALSN